MEGGVLALGVRLKRLSDMLNAEYDAVYKSRGAEITSRAFPALYILHNSNGCTLNDLARAMEVSHPAALQLRKELERRGLATVKSAKKDKRKSLIALTVEGKKLIRNLKPIWKEIKAGVGDILDTAAPQFLNQLYSFERELERIPLKSRLSKADFSHSRVEVIEYDSAYRQMFIDLNMEWLKRYFEPEESDLKLFSHLESIVKDGGMIFFVKCGGTIAATGALIRRGRGFELAKMAVSDPFQRKGIGRLLLAHVIGWAKDRKAGFIELETASVLKPAIRLYKSAGFKRFKHPRRVSSYARADVYMRIII